MRTKISKKTKAIALATGLTLMALSTVAFTQKSEDVSPATMGCEVTGSEVITYLEGYGYTNIVLTPVNGSTRATACDWIADTDYSYDTYVDCTETAITGHDDIE